jgi:hypothetical protein
MCQVYVSFYFNRAALNSQEGATPSERLKRKLQQLILISQKVRATAIKHKSTYFLLQTHSFIKNHLFGKHTSATAAMGK